MYVAIYKEGGKSLERVEERERGWEVLRQVVKCRESMRRRTSVSAERDGVLSEGREPL